METQMKYRKLGRTGLQVSVVGLGTWQFGNEHWGKTFEQDDVSGIINRAYDLGINLIDTAAGYGDHTAETFIGEAIKEDRGDWVIATSCGHYPWNGKSADESWDPDAIASQIEASLNALQTDYIDILQLNAPATEHFNSTAIWDRLHRLVGEGIVNHIGISVPDNGEDSLRQLERAPEFNISVAQFLYNRLQPDAEEELLEACQEHALGVLAGGPLASGFLSGNYPVGSRWEAPDLRATRSDDDIDALLAEVETLKAELPAGAQLPAWALSWVLENAAVAAVVPGSKSIEQLEQNVACLNLLNTDY